MQNIALLPAQSLEQPGFARASAASSQSVVWLRSGVLPPVSSEPVVEPSPRYQERRDHSGVTNQDAQLAVFGKRGRRNVF